MTTKKKPAAKGKKLKPKAKSELPRKKREVPPHIKAAADRAEALADGKPLPEVSDEGMDPAIKAATKGPGPKGGTKPTKVRGKTEAEKEAERVVRAAERALEAAEAYEPRLMGRPPKYKPEFARLARALCKRGATDLELADALGVSERTIGRWKVAYDDFCQALRVHKEDFDYQIERSLAHRANGFTIESEKVFHTNGRLTRAKVLEYIPPDVAAIKLWLTNRQPEKWRDKTQTELTGKDGGAIEVVSAARERVAERMKKLKEDGKKRA